MTPEKIKSLLKADKSGLVTGFCPLPWQEILINSDGYIFNCGCEGRLKISCGNIFDFNNSDEFINAIQNNPVKQTILDGSYKFCKASVCGFLQDNIISKTKTFFEDTPPSNSIKINRIFLQIDESCNLRCPTCRSELIMHKDKNRLDKIKNLISRLENLYLNHVTHKIILRPLGNGEIFASLILSKWFENFDFEKHPNVFFSLHTNGTLIKKFKNVISNHKNHIIEFEISIDAANEETYKKTRLGGKWTDLISGIKILQQLNIKFSLSFVVSSNNFRDIPDFLILGRKYGAYRLQFYRIQRWDMTSEKFDELNVSSPSHPLHNELLLIIKNTDKSIIDNNLHTISHWSSKN